MRRFALLSYIFYRSFEFLCFVGWSIADYALDFTHMTRRFSCSLVGIFVLLGSMIVVLSWSCRYTDFSLTEIPPDRGHNSIRQFDVFLSFFLFQETTKSIFLDFFCCLLGNTCRFLSFKQVIDKFGDLCFLLFCNKRVTFSHFCASQSSLCLCCFTERPKSPYIKGERSFGSNQRCRLQC